MVLSRFLVLLSVIICSTGLALASDVARERNERLFVVPAPENVVIDGDLSDWDKSGGIDIFITPETRAMQSIRFYAMYDDDALYLGGEVKDTTPMMNVHDPVTNPGYAWDSDAFQFRIYLKPTWPSSEESFNPVRHYDMVHLLLWYFTPAEQANLQAAYSFGYIHDPRHNRAGVVPHDILIRILNGVRQDCKPTGPFFAAYCHFHFSLAFTAHFPLVLGG